MIKKEKPLPLQGESKERGLTTAMKAYPTLSNTRVEVDSDLYSNW
jgi:hypothetical protein